MTNTKNDFPLVDTDIWVFLIMSGFYKRVIKNNGYLFFADVVEKEIMKWKSNKNKFEEIASIFKELKKQGKLSVIYFDEFDNLEKQSINHQLSEYGLKNVGFAEKNKGEFVSLLYGLHKSINRFKTNDRKFLTEIEDNTQNEIEIINWDIVLDKYSVSLKEKSEIKKVIFNQEIKMSKQQEKYKAENQDPRWEKLKLLI